MPQLNPAPWFLTLLISWVIYLVLFIPKLSATHLPTQPKSEEHSETTHSWTWPWY